MKLINDKKLRQLLINSEKLKRLEAAGVNNWIGYDEALSKNINYSYSFKEWLENYLDYIIVRYPDYVTDDDNFNFD